MRKELLPRLAGEFLVIVVGVLVALAVDDWRQYREQRRLESDLLNRLQTELVADAADLATARREMGARLWVLDAVLAGLGDQNAAARLDASRLESLTSPLAVDSLRAAAGRGPTWTFDPVEEPLGRAFMLWPEFDLSDDAYQEMIATGSLGIVRNPQLRSAIMRYYRVAEDQGANERQAGEYQDWLESALGSIGTSPGDPLTLSELVYRARGDRTFPVVVRRAQNRIRGQLIYLHNIDIARRELEAVFHSAGQVR